MSKHETPGQQAGRQTVAATLRAKGFIPLPPLWVRSEDMPEIHRIAEKYREDVNAVRAQIRGEALHASGEPDPTTDKEAAWAALERLRSAGL